MNNTGTTTLHQPQFLYAHNTTTRGSGTAIDNRTTYGDDGLQTAGTLAGTFILGHEHRNHTKQESNPGTTCKPA